MKRQNFNYYLAGSVALLTFLVYLSSLQNAFVLWDDEYYIFENPHIRSFDMDFFRWAFFDFYAANWHPLTWISHALDYAVWGLNPLGHHLTNNILHAMNTFLVVVLVTRLIEIANSPSPSRGEGSNVSPPLRGGDKGEGEKENSRFTSHDSRFTLITAAVTGLLFGLHPLHVESVAWVSERKDLLCALFYLLSVMSYIALRQAQGDNVRVNPSIRSEQAPSNVILSLSKDKHYLLSLLFFTLALLSKPMAVSLPVVLLILDWYPFNRITSLKSFRAAFIEKLPFIALSVASAVLTVLAQRSGDAVTAIEVIPLSTRMLVAAKSLIAYLWKMIAPLHLVPYYPYPNEASLFSLEYLSGIVLVVVITTVCISMVKKQKLLLSVWVYYVLTLVPVLGLVQVGGQSMADRYTYMPSLGPFLMTGLLVAYGAEWASLIKRGLISVKFFAAIAAIIALLSLSMLTHRQIGIWKNSLALWTYVIEKELTTVPLAYNNRGLAFFTIGEFDKAIEDYYQAIALDPRYAEAHSNLGIALSKKGLADEAIEEFQIAVQLSPGFANAHRNLAPALYKSGRIAEALEEYLIVTRLRPDDAGPHADLGSVYGAMGSYDKAIEHFQIALRLRPDFADVHYNLGIAYQAKGLMSQAVGELESAARLSPEDAAIRNDLARAYSLKNAAVLSK